MSVAIVQPADDVENAPLFPASGGICSLPILAASGFLNATSDADCIVRRAPLLIDFNGAVYPRLALAAAITATATRNLTFRVANVPDPRRIRKWAPGATRTMSGSDPRSADHYDGLSGRHEAINGKTARHVSNDSSFFRWRVHYVSLPRFSSGSEGS